MISYKYPADSFLQLVIPLTSKKSVTKFTFSFRQEIIFRNNVNAKPATELPIQDLKKDTVNPVSYLYP